MAKSRYNFLHSAVTFLTINPRNVAGKLKLLILFFVMVLGGFSIFIYQQVQTINRDYYKIEKYNFAFQNVFVILHSFTDMKSDITGKIYRKDSTLRDYQNNKFATTIDTVTYALGLADTVNFKLLPMKSAIADYAQIVREVAVEMIENEKQGLRSASIDSVLISKATDHQAAGRFYGILYGDFFPAVVNVKDITNNKLISNTKRLPYVIMLVSFLVAIGVVIAGKLILISFKNAINQPKEMLEDLALGKLPDALKETEDELSYIIKASNNLADNLRNASNFALEIGKSNFQHHYTPSSTHDTLGNALVKMNNDLKAFNEKEKQINWAVTGQAKFAEIIRSSNQNVKETCDQIVAQLVKYLGANQGGLFFYENASNQLEMLACYAYDRAKYLTKNIHIGEGLVGQCFQEGETIYINDVPDDYIRIVSGLGTANPRAILLVPMKYNEKIEGVIEVATFNDFAPYQIEFVEKLGEMLGTSISNIRHNKYTELLLSESQHKSQSLAQQEEELRQNLEELHATQEEQMRREQTYLEEIRNLKKFVHSS